MKYLLNIFICIPTLLFSQIEHVVFTPPLELSAPYQVLPDFDSNCAHDNAEFDLLGSATNPIDITTRGTCFYVSGNVHGAGYVFLNLGSITTQFACQAVNLVDPIGTSFTNAAQPFECNAIIDDGLDYDYQILVYWDGINGLNEFAEFSQTNTYVGFRSMFPDGWHYGWIHIQGYKTMVSGVETIVAKVYEYAIEETPNIPIEVCSTISAVPYGLQQTYNPYGILLNWAPYPNSVGCQVGGGPEGGTDPHNFIVQGNMPTQLFINGNGLTVGQNYQWKVRCATGLNPPTGVSPWSTYDYFIYDP